MESETPTILFQPWAQTGRCQLSTPLTASYSASVLQIRVSANSFVNLRGFSKTKWKTKEVKKKKKKKKTNGPASHESVTFLSPATLRSAWAARSKVKKRILEAIETQSRNRAISTPSGSCPRSQSHILEKSQQENLSETWHTFTSTRWAGLHLCQFDSKLNQRWVGRLTVRVLIKSKSTNASAKLKGRFLKTLRMAGRSLTQSAKKNRGRTLLSKGCVCHWCLSTKGQTDFFLGFKQCGCVQGLVRIPHQVSPCHRRAPQGSCIATKDNVLWLAIDEDFQIFPSNRRALYNSFPNWMYRWGSVAQRLHI